MTKVCKRYGVGTKKGRQILDLHGVEYRGRVGIGRMPVGSYEKEFFVRQTPRSAYWAGFLYADGCIVRRDSTHTTSYSLSLGLQIGDKEHVLQFCRDIGLDVARAKIRVRPHKERHHQNMFRAEINGRELGDVMKVWGIVPCKTETFREPLVEEGVLPHFLRGWFDGDGHLNPAGCWSLVSHKNACEWYISSLRRLGYKGNISRDYLYPNGYTEAIKAGGRLRVWDIMKCLKYDQDFCLARKKTAFEDLDDHIRQGRYRTPSEYKEICS